MNKIEARIRELGYRPRMVVVDLSDKTKYHCTVEKGLGEVDFTAVTEEDVDRALLNK